MKWTDDSYGNDFPGCQILVSDENFRFAAIREKVEGGYHVYIIDDHERDPGFSLSEIKSSFDNLETAKDYAAIYSLGVREAVKGNESITAEFRNHLGFGDSLDVDTIAEVLDSFQDFSAAQSAGAIAYKIFMDSGIYADVGVIENHLEDSPQESQKNPRDLALWLSNAYFKEINSVAGLYCLTYDGRKNHSRNFPILHSAIANSGIKPGDTHATLESALNMTKKLSVISQSVPLSYVYKCFALSPVRDKCFFDAAAERLNSYITVVLPERFGQSKEIARTLEGPSR